LTIFRNYHVSFSKNPSLDLWNSRWRTSTIHRLENC